MCKTGKIRVEATSEYVASQSDSTRQRYVFAYHIRITHEAGPRCQLLTRHWIITDGSGEVEEVKGEGVIGQQPVLSQGEQFVYSSGAVLKTPVGAMQGSYQFRSENGDLFDVPIPAFSLSMPNLVH